jgi:hypothetical protein
MKGTVMLNAHCIICVAATVHAWIQRLFFECYLALCAIGFSRQQGACVLLFAGLASLDVLVCSDCSCIYSVRCVCLRDLGVLLSGLSRSMHNGHVSLCTSPCFCSVQPDSCCMLHRGCGNLVACMRSCVFLPYVGLQDVQVFITVPCWLLVLNLSAHADYPSIIWKLECCRACLTMQLTLYFMCRLGHTWSWQCLSTAQLLPSYTHGALCHIAGRTVCKGCTYIRESCTICTFLAVRPAM